MENEPVKEESTTVPAAEETKPPAGVNEEKTKNPGIKLSFEPGDPERIREAIRLAAEFMNGMADKKFGVSIQVCAEGQQVCQLSNMAVPATLGALCYAQEVTKNGLKAGQLFNGMVQHFEQEPALVKRMFDAIEKAHGGGELGIPEPEKTNPESAPAL